MVGILTICDNKVLCIRFTRASKIEPCWGQIEKTRVQTAEGRALLKALY